MARVSEAVGQTGDHSREATVTTLSAARARAITAFSEYRRLGAERFPRPEMVDAWREVCAALDGLAEVEKTSDGD